MNSKLNLKNSQNIALPPAILQAISDIPNGARVVVAMSGGVDSSVCAAIMNYCGFEVIGITLQLYDHGAAINKKGACCAGADIMDARKVAHKIGIKHFVLDYETIFRESVIDNFVESYLKGETPLPCVRCNQSVKFADLMKFAQENEAFALITGHYVQRFIGDDNQVSLHSAENPDKDQSYFLFATTSAQLQYLRFPLGGISKQETRALAEFFELTIADKPDSQDICFVPNGDYAAIVKKLRPDAVHGGDIIHVNGQVLGKHHGTIGYTIGQRKGIGVGGRSDKDEPLYVIAIDSQKRQIIVGEKEYLRIASLNLTNCNWLNAPKNEWEEIQVKYRSTMMPVGAKIKCHNENQAIIVFDNEQYSVAKGQALVVYRQNSVLGGGWIE